MKRHSVQFNLKSFIYGIYQLLSSKLFKARTHLQEADVIRKMYKICSTDIKVSINLMRIILYQSKLFTIELTSDRCIENHLCQQLICYFSMKIMTRVLIILQPTTLNKITCETDDGLNGNVKICYTLWGFEFGFKGAAQIHEKCIRSQII